MPQPGVCPCGIDIRENDYYRKANSLYYIPHRPECPAALLEKTPPEPLRELPPNQPFRARKKPVEIIAHEFNPDLTPWPEGVIVKKESPTGYWIGTLEGGHEVTPGDIIITGVKGERYPCKPDIFRMIYDPID